MSSTTLWWLGLLCLIPAAASAQSDSGPDTRTDPGELRVSLDILGAGYQDWSQTRLGHEGQGRLGWVVIGIAGELSEHVSFLVEINPASDAATPEPACGEAGYFYPNVPDPAAPPVACTPDGRDRVDLYRFVGLDPLTQQGALRQTVVDFHASARTLGIGLGRFVVPLGLDWREAGSWTNLDAPLIQRLNAETGFGARGYGVRSLGSRAALRLEAAAYRGDTKRAFEYTYSGFVDDSIDTNSDLTFAGRVTATLADRLALRLSTKYGFSGSRVPEYPSFQLSKRRDHAVVVSAQYDATPWIRVFGEHATYWSGLPDTSARAIGLEPANVMKAGAYVGTEVRFPLPHRWRGAVVGTYEDLSRNDSLVWFLSQQGLYRARLGERVTSAAVRIRVSPADNLDLGFFWNSLDNPFPWLSGIVPVDGPEAYTPRPQGSRKWGFLFHLHWER